MLIEEESIRELTGLRFEEEFRIYDRPGLIYKFSHEDGCLYKRDMFDPLDSWRMEPSLTVFDICKVEMTKIL